MKWIVVGALLAVFGGVGLWLGGIPYTERETLELGPIQASADVERMYEVPPLAAGALMSLGVGLVIWGLARRQ